MNSEAVLMKVVLIAKNPKKQNKSLTELAYISAMAEAYAPEKLPSRISVFSPSSP